jgi:hypothetical protein
MMRFVDHERAGLGDERRADPGIRKEERMVHDHHVRFPRLSPRRLGKTPACRVAAAPAAEERIRSDLREERRGRIDPVTTKLFQLARIGFLDPADEPLESVLVEPVRPEHPTLAQARERAARQR